MRKTTIIVLIIMSTVLLSCKELSVKYSDSGSSVDMVVGQVVKIELPANASTGNTWRKIMYNDSVIVKSGKPNYMLGDDRIGSAGVYYYRFEAVNAGTTELIMEYGSKFDDKKEALKIFTLNINVHEVKD